MHTFGGFSSENISGSLAYLEQIGVLINKTVSDGTTTLLEANLEIKTPNLYQKLKKLRAINRIMDFLSIGVRHWS